MHTGSQTWLTPKNHQRCVAWRKGDPQHPSFAARNPMNCYESKFPTRRHFELSPIARNFIINLAEPTMNTLPSVIVNHGLALIRPSREPSSSPRLSHSLKGCRTLEPMGFNLLGGYSPNNHDMSWFDTFRYLNGTFPIKHPRGLIRGWHYHVSSF